MLGSLHLDTEEEPRRGASRANSVRFDESALHGHIGHVSRSSSDFFPLRTGSGLGSHPMTERSFSHKSDGRQSSAGQSVQSARTDSLGLEARHPSLAVGSPLIPLGPPPGLSILGPVPAIIRCWLDTNFSNESLLYAAVCTGSYKSLLDLQLASRMGLDQQIRDQRGERKVKVQVYLPEATIQQSSSRSNSPAPQLPMLTVDFTIQEMAPKDHAIQIFVGSDVLRARNADLLFSQDRLTLYDDDRNKLVVPLVRPENPTVYRRLVTTNEVGDPSTASPGPYTLHQWPVNQSSKRNEEVPRLTVDTKTPGTPSDEPSGQASSNAALSPINIPAPKQSAIGEGLYSSLNREEGEEEPSTVPETISRESIPPTNGIAPDTPTRAESGSIWGSWRRDSSQNTRPDTTFSTIASNANYHRAGRGRGMKVLKPARSVITPRSNPPSQAPTGFDASSSHSVEDGRRGSQANIGDSQDAQTSQTLKRSSFGEVKHPLQPLTNRPRSANPIGGASAFGWLNSNQQKPPSATIE